MSLDWIERRLDEAIERGEITEQEARAILRDEIQQERWMEDYE